MEHDRISAHHAYAVEGGEEAREKLLKVLAGSWGIEVKCNPDFLHRKFETLGIDEARNLKELQEKKSFALGGKKVFVIDAASITVEAQNSLLKIFEEPTENTHFFLSGKCVKNLIPTLASRISTMRLEGAPSASVKISADGAKEFLSLPTSKRLAFVKKLSDDIKDEKKTKSDAIALIRQIEEILYQKSKKEGGLPPKILEDIEMCGEYMSDRSANVKMLSEYVALIAPHIE